MLRHRAVPWSGRPPATTPINRGAGIAQGLVFAAPLVDASSSDLVLGIRPTQGTVTWAQAIARYAPSDIGGTRVSLAPPLGLVPTVTSGAFEFPNRPGINPGTGNLTISAWVRTTAQVGSQWIVQHRDGVNTPFIGLLLSDDGGALVGIMWCRDASSNSSQAVSAIGGPRIPLNTWVHLVGVKEGTTTRVYINAVLEGTATNGSLGSCDNSGPIYVGRNSLDGERVQGQITDLRIWNRALTQAEIQSVYHPTTRWTMLQSPTLPRLYIDVGAGAGAQDVTATVATASWTAPAATAAPGAVTRTTTVATASWTAPAATAAPGAVTTAATVATASWVAPAATATVGAVTVTATEAIASWVAPAATATAGAVTVTASPALATWTTPAGTATGGNTVAATVATAAWAAPAATATVGAVTVTASPATASWSAPAATATPGAVTVTAVVALASWVAPAATVGSDVYLPATRTALAGRVPSIRAGRAPAVRAGRPPTVRAR